MEIEVLVTMVIGVIIFFGLIYIGKAHKNKVLNDIIQDIDESDLPFDHKQELKKEIQEIYES